MITQLPPVGEIKRFFPIHRKSVVEVFMLLVQCILRCRTVCLYKCRSEVGSVLGKKDYKIATAYTRLIRFFKVWQSHTGIEITLLGDREFIGAKWFGFLRKVDFSFVIRARWQDYWGEVSISLNKTIANTEKEILRSVRQKGYFQTPIVI